MSAIAGIYHLTQEPVISEQIDGMMKALRIFPADDIQVHHNEYVSLGCHAQWITPESIGEANPYYEYERDISIVTDAIIDNRKELFEKLQVKKSDQKNITDTQLILLAYQKWEEDCPKYLVGDFAFMIWDEQKQKMFGARDFSGSRTLYYHYDNQHFAFCTVIKPLLTLPYIQKQFNEEWLAEYLAISAVIDTADTTITPYKDVTQIPPSHSICVTRETVKISRYCTLTMDEKLKFKSNDDYIEAFQEVYQQAVNDRLRTHRKIGAQLSGGLDSGSVVSFAAKELKKQKKQLHTFSYIPPKDFKDFTANYLVANETPYIKSTVDYVGGIDDYYLDFEGADSFTNVADMLEIMEMPYKFFENTFWIKGIFEKAQEHNIGVLLSGERGNLSISWGSAAEYYVELFKKFKWFRLLKEVNCHTQNEGGSRLRKLSVIRKLALSSNQTTEKTVFSLLINPEFAINTSIYKKLQNYGIDDTGWYSTNSLEEERFRHFNDIYQWNNTNTLATKLSLRHGLWKRDPTNDLRVIRFCLSLSEDQFVQKGYDRALIRQSTKNFLPDKIRLNQKVRGEQGADWVYRMLPHWNQFLEELHALRKDPAIQRYLNTEIIEKSLVKLSKKPNIESYTKPEYRILMRSLIIYRYMKSFH